MAPQTAVRFLGVIIICLPEYLLVKSTLYDANSARKSGDAVFPRRTVPKQFLRALKNVRRGPHQDEYVCPPWYLSWFTRYETTVAVLPVVYSCVL